MNRRHFLRFGIAAASASVTTHAGNAFAYRPLNSNGSGDSGSGGKRQGKKRKRRKQRG